MDSDDLFENAGSNEQSRRHRVDTSAFEDIARELEEDTTSAGPSRDPSDGDGDEDPDAWLLQQYGAEEQTVEEGDAWTSEDGGDGMDVDGADELKDTKKKTVVVEEAPKEKAAYTSSGRLLVPSHKSREAKAAAGAMALAWEEMETQGALPVGKRKSGGAKSKSRSVPKATGSGSGMPQPRAAGAGTKSSSKTKSLPMSGTKSAAAALALAASKSASSKPKKKGDKRAKDKEARSRSESRQVETPAPEAVLQAVAKVAIAEPAEEEEEDSRLYCICKTRYDEEKIMIACDRCDDWYHPGCVKLPESDIELIDQFVCPLCVTKYSAHTTYKTRCAVKDCTKPARAPVSKYCSNACGLKNAAAQLQTLRARGVNMDQLWHAAKEARAPEGVVYVHLPGGPTPHPPPPGVNNIGPNATKLMDGRQKADLEKLAMMTERLKQFAARRGALELEIKQLKARLRLLGCAMRRIETTGGDRCGFDARVVMNDEEWVEWLESKGKWTLEEPPEGEEDKGETMYASNEEAFCAGKKRCERHNGWQNLKFADFSGECAAKEFQLADVNSKHQETQRKITDLQNTMSSVARPLTERIILPAADDVTITT